MFFRIPPKITPLIPPEIFLDLSRSLSSILRIFLHDPLKGFSLIFYKTSSRMFTDFLFRIPAKVTPGVVSGICLTLPESKFFQKILQKPSSIPSGILRYFADLSRTSSRLLFRGICGMSLDLFFWQSPEMLF